MGASGTTNSRLGGIASLKVVRHGRAGSQPPRASPGRLSPNLLWHGCPGAEQSTACAVEVYSAAANLLAADGRQRQLGQRMAHKLRLHAPLPVERLLKGKDHQHPAHIFLHQLDAVLLPRPQLRAHKEDHRHAQPVELLGQLEMDVGEVDEHGHIRPPLRVSPVSACGTPCRCAAGGGRPR